MAKDFSFEIVRNYGTLSTSKSGWTKEVNLVSWNSAEPKMDIREWSPDHSTMGKGVTLGAEDVKVLKAILNALTD